MNPDAVGGVRPIKLNDVGRSNTPGSWAGQSLIARSDIEKFLVDRALA